MMQNSKKLALGYLAQAQALLPKVGIEDHPGDGGPDFGKLTRTDVVELYAKIIDIQNTLGQSAAAKATFEKAKTLIMVGKEAHQGVVALLLKRSPSKAEAVALFKKYATDGYLDDALVLLAKLTDKSNVGQFPPALVDALGVDAYIALLRRTKNSTVGYKSAVDSDFFNRESDVRLKLMQAVSAMEPQAISARDWHRLLEFAYGPEIAVVHAGIRKALRRDLPEQEKYWKQRPAPGRGELSARQAEWEEIVVVAAQTEPALALKYLAKLTEPRRKVGALLALAEAEALKSQPKGDLG